MTHAFFKALLFLGSGSVIHAMHHEQDMRKMGRAVAENSVHLPDDAGRHFGAGGSFLSAGFFSKDAILEADDTVTGMAASYGFIMTVAAAALTSFYSWRLIFKTFHGEPHDHHHYEAAHESPLVMLIPLAVLAVGSIGAGWAFWHIFEGKGAEEFFRGSLTFSPNNHVLEDMEHLPLTVTLAPTVMMIIGFLLAWQFYIRRPDIPENSGARSGRALPLPTQCLVFRLDLRQDLRASGDVARPAVVEGR